MSTGQLDTTDERNSHDSSPAGRLRAALRDIRSGDLGALPGVVRGQRVDRRGAGGTPSAVAI